MNEENEMKNGIRGCKQLQIVEKCHHVNKKMFTRDDRNLSYDSRENGCKKTISHH